MGLVSETGMINDGRFCWGSSESSETIISTVVANIVRRPDGNAQLRTFDRGFVGLTHHGAHRGMFFEAYICTVHVTQDRNSHFRRYYCYLIDTAFEKKREKMGVYDHNREAAFRWTRGRAVLLAFGRRSNA